MLNVNDFFARLEFPVLNPPASREALARLSEAFRDLPTAYLNLIRERDGFEGFLSEENYVMFWSIDEVIKYKDGCLVPQYGPGLVVFASNGGTAGYAFDTRHCPMPVVEVPFIGSAEDAEILANNFDSFVEWLRGRAAQ